MNAAYVDTEGTYECDCHDQAGNGFGSDGCLDVNECSTGDTQCDANAKCTNKV